MQENLHAITLARNQILLHKNDTLKLTESMDKFTKLRKERKFVLNLMKAIKDSCVNTKKPFSIPEMGPVFNLLDVAGQAQVFDVMVKRSIKFKEIKKLAGEITRDFGSAKPAFDEAKKDTLGNEKQVKAQIEDVKARGGSAKEVENLSKTISRGSVSGGFFYQIFN